MVDMPTSFEALTPEPPREVLTSRGRLSPAEIEALLRPDLSDMDPAPTEPDQITPRDIPDLTDPVPAAAPVRTADDAHAAAARRLASRLSLALRESCGLRAAATVAKNELGDFQDGLMDQSHGKGRAVACFSGPNGEIVAMLSLAPALANALIETACGGKISPFSPRVLTPLDAALLEGLVRPLGTAISAEFSFARIETDYEFVRALAAPAAAHIIDFDVRVETETLSARLVMVEEDQDGLFDAPALTQQQHAPAPSAPVASTVVPSATGAMTALLTARIASLSVPLSSLTDLKAGSTLLLGLPADQPVELLSGGRNGPVAAEAQIGRKGNKMALRITKRGPALR